MAGLFSIEGFPINIPQPAAFQCFEGLIESDVFKPCPLFVNIRLIATEREIRMPRERPLFQVQPIRRECYADATLGWFQPECTVPL